MKNGDTFNLQKDKNVQYPEWHKKPLRLTIAETRNPYQVLDDFFQNYRLTDARQYLKEWLQESMRTGDAAIPEQVWFHEHIEKLVEAAFLLRQFKRTGTVKIFIIPVP